MARNSAISLCILQYRWRGYRAFRECWPTCRATSLHHRPPIASTLFCGTKMDWGSHCTGDYELVLGVETSRERFISEFWYFTVLCHFIGLKCRREYFSFKKRLCFILLQVLFLVLQPSHYTKTPLGEKKFLFKLYSIFITQTRLQYLNIYPVF